MEKTSTTGWAAKETTMIGVNTGTNSALVGTLAGGVSGSIVVIALVILLILLTLLWVIRKRQRCANKNDDLKLPQHHQTQTHHQTQIKETNQVTQVVITEGECDQSMMVNSDCVYSIPTVRNVAYKTFNIANDENEYY